MLHDEVVACSLNAGSYATASEIDAQGAQAAEAVAGRRAPAPEAALAPHEAPHHHTHAMLETAAAYVVA